jgi:MFS family permease
MLILGLGNGYIAIILFTWMQSHTPKDMLGRMMSIVVLSSSGLVPVSQAISGAVIRWSLNSLFITAGVLCVLATFWAAFQPGLRSLSENLAVVQPAD